MPASPTTSEPAGCPDPQWAEHLAQCPSCAYDLAALASQARCPECGEEFSRGVLILHGIPQSGSGTPIWRRLLWVAVVAGWWILIQFGIVAAMVMGKSIWVLAPLVLALTAATVYLIRSSQRERSSVERIVFTSTSVIRMPRAGAQSGAKFDSLALRYPPGCRLYLKRISPVWAKLTIAVPNTPSPLIAAGFRCPEASLQTVGETIQSLLGGPTIKAAESPPTGESQAFPPPLPDEHRGS